MKPSSKITYPILIAVTMLALMLVLSRCSGPPEITVADLAQAQKIYPYIVRVPDEPGEKYTVSLELVGKDGVVERDTFLDGLNGGTILKVFVLNEPKVTVSVLTEGVGSSIGLDLDVGNATLRKYFGVAPTIHEPGDILAVFGTESTRTGVPLELVGDDLGLRVVVDTIAKSSESENGKSRQ